MASAADLLCYAALCLNLVAMSMSSQTALRSLSLLANLLLCLYALAIGAAALVYAACALIVIHSGHLLYARHRRREKPA